MDEYGPITILVWAVGAIILMAGLMFLLAWMEATLPTGPSPEPRVGGAAAAVRTPRRDLSAALGLKDVAVSSLTRPGTVLIGPQSAK